MNKRLSDQFGTLYRKRKAEQKADYDRNVAKVTREYTQNWGKLKDDYWNAATQGDENLGTALRNKTGEMAARNIADSSYMGDARQGIISDFKNDYSALNKNLQRGQADLNQWKADSLYDLNKAKAENDYQMNALWQTFRRPKRPVYTDLSQLLTVLNKTR